MIQNPTISGSLAVTGMGAVSTHGAGCGVLWEAVVAGQCGIRTISRFPTTEFPTHLGALVPGWDDPQYAVRRDGSGILCEKFARLAAREAWQNAQLDRADFPATRLALILGSGLGEMGDYLHTVAEELAAELHLMAGWLGLDDIVVADRGDLSSALRSAV